MKEPPSIILMSAVAMLLMSASTAITEASPLAKCGNRIELAEILKEKFDQVPVGGGVSHENTHAFEVFASQDGAWTVLMTKTDGQTCVMAGGHSWEEFKTKMPGTPT